MLCENYKSCAAAGYTVLISWKKKDGKQNIYCEKNPFAESRIEFPLIRYEISPADLYSIFAELKNFYIEPVPVLHRAKDVICDETFKPANSHVSFIFDENSKKFVKLVDYFGEINRLKTRRNNQFESVWDLFGRVKDRVIYGLEGKQKITTADVYAEFTKFNPRFASEFNPAWMTAVIKYLRGFTKIENVLDMSAGRGARAIAAAATGCKYFGTDPNLDIDYETIINFYNVNGTVQYSAFEKASIKGPFDLMLSSPPYFDLEIYSNHPGDSLRENTNLDGWLKNFMFVSIDKISTLLRPGGLMVINIDNPIYQDVNYVQPIVDHAVPQMEFIGLITVVRTVPFSF